MRIITSRISLITTISEIVGYKSGLALSQEEVLDHLTDFHDTLSGEDDEILALRGELYEEMIGRLLYNMGNIPTPTPTFPGITMFHKYKGDRNKLSLFETIFQLFLDLFPAALNESKKDNSPINVTPFIIEAENKFGKIGLKMAWEFIDSIQLCLHVSPLSGFRLIAWKNIEELSDLFKSESLDAVHGAFIDQRFIDYVNRNFDSIDKINWRKFEALTCEFFEKAGFHVEISSGRNDNSIDARIWPEKSSKGLPPTILVQCKRQKRKIDKVVVKALWADVLEENSKSGLIVTTSALSPGAEAVCNARSYRIFQANRDTLKIWIELMRSPYTGVFMGE